MVDTDEVLRQQAAWRRAAAGWQRWQHLLRETSQPVTDWLLTALDPQPGQRLLELAAGPGETGLAAAALVAPGGTLLSTDQSSEMVEVARARAAELGVTNVEFAVADAERPGLTGPFDGAICRFGYMLMGDPAAALQATHTLLAPGARLVLAVWDVPQRNPGLIAVAMQLIARGLVPAPTPDAPGPFALADQETLRELLFTAGFTVDTITSLPMTFGYADFELYWRSSLDLTPFAAILERLEPAVLEEIKVATHSSLARFEDVDGALAVPACAVLAAARAGR